MLKKKSFVIGLATMMFMTSMTVVPINVFAAENINDQQVEEKTPFEIRDANDLAILSEELDRFIEQNPNSTEFEQEQHLISFIENGRLNHISFRSLGDYLPGYNSLNYTERKLAVAHPFQAVKVYNAANTATEKTIDVYGYNGEDDNSDAFRHTIWNALMKQSIGESAAEEWATAHENDSSGLPKRMDLHNNSIGRSLNVSGKSLSSIVSLVKSKVRNGYCKRIVRGSLVATNGAGM